MHRPAALRAARLAGVSLFLVATVASAAKGHLGFAVEVATSGFFLNPTLETVTIAKVTPGSPSARAGLRVGDTVLDVDGAAVRGTPARPLGAKLQSVVAGQHVRMTVRHADGRTATLDLVAAP